MNSPARIGRTRALMGSILMYSIASFACGLSQSIPQLAVFRFILGLGMGGEWTTGAALIAETWRAEHRGKALGLMQSSWAIGEMLAAGERSMHALVAALGPSVRWFDEPEWSAVTTERCFVDVDTPEDAHRFGLEGPG